MTNKMLNMYVRNQIMFHPTYMGEDIIIQGERHSTHEIAEAYQSSSRFQKQSGELELYMVSIRNNDTLKINNQGSKIPLSSLVETFKEGLFDKSNLDSIIDKFMPYVVQAISAQCAYGSGYIIDDNIMINAFSEDICNRALQHIFGNSPSRFIYTFTNKTTNGNFIDLHKDSLQRFFNLKQEFFTYASAVRAFGYPYSDYKSFISKGILVSIDMSKRIFVTHDDYVYCINIDTFNNVLSQGLSAIGDCRKVFNTSDLTLNTKASLGGLR